MIRNYPIFNQISLILISLYCTAIKTINQLWCTFTFNKKEDEEKKQHSSSMTLM